MEIANKKKVTFWLGLLGALGMSNLVTLYFSQDIAHFLALESNNLALADDAASCTPVAVSASGNEEVYFGGCGGIF